MKKLIITSTRTDDYTAQLALAQALLRGADRLDEGQSEAIRDARYDVVIAPAISTDLIEALQAMNTVVVILGPMALYSSVADIVIDYRAGSAQGRFAGPAFSLDHPDFDFIGLTDLAKKLEWDTDFWGYGIGSLRTKELTSNVYAKVRQAMLSEDIRMLEYLCSLEDRDSVRTAELHGFNLTDIRVTFEVKTRAIDIDALPIGLSYGIAEPRHIPELIRLSTDLYRDSRYYFDGNFDHSRISRLYNTWVEKAVLGTFDHICYCIFEGDLPLGFVTIRHLQRGRASIGLVGLGQENKGKGLGKKLCSYVINQCLAKGIGVITTVTQGRNTNAIRLYESVGFRTGKMELWYHKWL